MNIRNFAIIAHIDHGKSTLADRLLEITKTVEAGRHDEQLLDRNPISRERGITIKLAPVRMEYKQTTINLIDTPGHVDFSYEVDRTLACVEGVILLVDATKGIQAQTISNAYKAIDKGLTIIPAVNKVDLPSADVDGAKQQIADFLGIDTNEISGISAKTGLGVEELFDRVLAEIPPPAGFPDEVSIGDSLGSTVHNNSSYNRKATDPSGPNHKEGATDESSSKPLEGATDASIPTLPEAATEMQKAALQQRISDETPSDIAQALIFDSYYDQHKGVIAFVRIYNGTFTKGQKTQLAINNKTVEATEVGIFKPDLIPTDSLSTGDIGYIVTNLKDIHQVRVGDTIIDGKGLSPAMPGYKKVNPMVYASMFTTDTADYLNLKKALEKLYLNDSSLDYSAIYSTALGAGFRVGFLGLLHAEVVRDRLEREFELSLILTPPQVDFKFENGTYHEPYVKILIVAPETQIGSVLTLCESYRATFITMDNKNQVSMQYEMPMSELISDFFDKLKSITSGYASLDWEFMEFRPANADKMAILLNGDEVEEFSEIVVQERAQQKGQFLTKQLKELIPRQQFELKIQAHYKGKIIASERMSAFRKDVTAKLYGGDRTRKDKLLKKQKEGKKKMKMIGQVEVPKEAFMQLFNTKKTG